MPPDQQCFDLLGKEPLGELFRAGWDFAQLSPEISACVAVQTARAGMNVNVNSSHEQLA
jgi:hypothetical protein